MVIEGRADLQQAYQDEGEARTYVARRFETPLGALLHRRQVSVVREVAEAAGVTSAVEIAPGPARVTVDVLSVIPSVVLVDASREMLDEASRRLAERGLAERATVVQSDAFHLPFTDTVDFVYTFRFIRHFDRADRLALYRECARILAPGGWLVFDAVNERVAAPLRAKDAELRHYDALLTREALREELAEAGFRIERLEGVQRRMAWLVQVQVLVAPRSDALARALMAVIDRTGGEPLEWVVVCRRV